MTMTYPPIDPYTRGYLAREPQHRLYVEQCGSPAGIPVVVLHGGPGSGCRAEQRTLFDPAAFRIILPDQRGAGRSRPFGSLAGNDTDTLVADLEALRRALEIRRWVVFGGSWGATLALRYAASHPERVSGLVLRGVLAGRRRDRDWVFGADGVARLYPEAYRRFLSVLPADLRDRPLAGYATLFTDQSASTRRRAAEAWLAWEVHVATGSHAGGRADGPAVAVERAQIACHYAVNDFFLDPWEGALPDHGALAGVPGTIVHGRRDLICPVEQAYAVHERWPAATLEIVEDGGHLAGQAPMQSALVAATDRLRDCPGH